MPAATMLPRPGTIWRRALVASKGRCKIMMPGVEGRASRPRLMTEGGDARLTLDPATGLNRYYSAPRPSAALAYASSTANDISPAAYARARAVLAEIGPEPAGRAYAERLEALRGRIRAAYGIAEDVAIVFAPSGTDLEYVALACVAGRAPCGHARGPARRRRGRLGLHPQRPRPLFRQRDGARRRDQSPGEPVPGLGGVACRADRHPGPRPDGPGPPLPLYRRADAVLDRRGALGEPPQPRPYRPRLEDRADPALARRPRPADSGGATLWSSTPARRGSPARR